MEIKELTCIGCPMGCILNVKIENGRVESVTGHTCPRGEQYARKEVVNPTRIVTSTVSVQNGNLPVVSVKTDRDISKNKIKECINALRDITVKAPVNIGDIIVHNVADTGCNIISTKKIDVI